MAKLGTSSRLSRPGTTGAAFPDRRVRARESAQISFKTSSRFVAELKKSCRSTQITAGRLIGLALRNFERLDVDEVLGLVGEGHDAKGNSVQINVRLAR